jgi:hypothetical protein
MPALVGLWEATWWQFLLPVALTLVCTLAVARVYRTTVLQSGGRVRLRALGH